MPLRSSTLASLRQRLESVEGHIRGVRAMAERGEDCGALLTQLRAVSAAVDRVAAIVLREHIDQCLKAAITSGDREGALTELDAVLKQIPLGGELES